jgi:putative nucleotidyltransferase with HDIG domain
MSNKVKLYLFFVCFTGLTIMIYSFTQFPIIDIRSFLIFAVLAVFGEILVISLPKGAAISVGFAINLSSILIFGTQPAALVAFIGMSIGSYQDWHLGWYKILFNAFTLYITTYTSGLAYYSFPGITPGRFDLLHSMFPLIISVIVYFVINNLLMTIVMGLATKTSYLKIWKNNLRKVAYNYVSLAPLGILMAGIYINMGVYAVLLFFAPLLLARYSFKLYADMCEYYLSTVQALAIAIEAKDKYTKGHSERVADYAVKIGEYLKLTEEELETLRYAGLLHDIGKIGIPENILNKPDKLEKWEYEKIKDHPQIGANIVQDIGFLRNAAQFIKYHHERWDGSGYPDKLNGGRISLGASILAAADVYDAMTSDRPYRRALTVDDALNELRSGSGKLYNPIVVEAIVNVMEQEQEKENVV